MIEMLEYYFCVFYSKRHSTFKGNNMKRHADHKISDIFINRWSPRAMSGESIAHEELMSLFEAARWAPSSFNGQPW